MIAMTTARRHANFVKKSWSLTNCIGRLGCAMNATISLIRIAGFAKTSWTKNSFIGAQAFAIHAMMLRSRIAKCALGSWLLTSCIGRRVSATYATINQRRIVRNAALRYSLQSSIGNQAFAITAMCVSGKPARNATATFLLGSSVGPRTCATIAMKNAVLVPATNASRAKCRSKMKNASGVADFAIHAGAGLPANANYVLNALLLIRSTGEQVSAIPVTTRLRKSAGDVQPQLNLDAWAGAQDSATTAMNIATNSAGCVIPILPKSARLHLALCIGAQDSAIPALIPARRCARPVRQSLA